MTSRWCKRVSLSLLLVALGGLVQPAVAARLASEPCCPGMAAVKDGHPDENRTRCQWITSTPCCDEAAATGAPPVFTPPPPLVCFQAALPSRPGEHPMPAPAAAPTSQAAALATVVLRL